MKPFHQTCLRHIFTQTVRCARRSHSRVFATTSLPSVTADESFPPISENGSSKTSRQPASNGSNLSVEPRNAPPPRCAILGQNDPLRVAPEGVRFSSTQESILEESGEVHEEKIPEVFLKLSPEDLAYPAGFLGGISDLTLPTERSFVEDSQTSLGYLRRILTSKVYDVAIESPLDLAPKLSARVGNNIFLKREDMQQVFSFKLRGAYNMMANLTKEQLAQGVICSSAGNHAQGVALAAKRLGASAVIAMPVTTPDIKWLSVQRLGAEVVLVGDSYDATQAYAKQRALEEGRIFVPPFDDPDVIAGQGTVGMEILRQLESKNLHAIFVPVGGGGLIAGIATYVKNLRPDVRVIGVEPTDANAMALSLYRGERVELSSVGKFADGVAVKMVGEETFRMCRELVDGVVLVNRDAICAAIKDMFEETRSILEPAGALAIAGAKAYCSYYSLTDENVVAVTSGANMNFDRLRLVAELADVGARKEAVLATLLPEVKGSFKQFADLVSAGINITEFKYRFNIYERAHVLYSVGVHKEEELESMVQRLQSGGFTTVDLTDNELAKDHLRHLVGGRSDLPHEILFRFVFPERPGALMKFLDAFSPRWNITLFHYRRQGEMGANILVGLEILPEEEEEFKLRAEDLGFEYTDERNNEALLMFMR